jgi:hypothetical protein
LTSVDGWFILSVNTIKGEINMRLNTTVKIVFGNEIEVTEDTVDNDFEITITEDYECATFSGLTAEELMEIGQRLINIAFNSLKENQK